MQERQLQRLAGEDPTRLRATRATQAPGGWACAPEGHVPEAATAHSDERPLLTATAERPGSGTHSSSNPQRVNAGEDVEGTEPPALLAEM